MRGQVQRLTLSLQAVDLLRERIFSHELPPGHRLDEADLAATLGISRTPLREALKVLSTEGLIEQRPNRGCYVAELTLGDLAEIFPIMATLEGCVAHEVATKRSADDLRCLDGLHAELEAHALAGDIDRYYATNYVFHETLQKLTGNRWLQAVIGDLRKTLKLSRHRSLRLEGRLQGSLGEHRELMQALHAGDAAGAERIMREHLLAQLTALQAIAGRESGAAGG